MNIFIVAVINNVVPNASHECIDAIMNTYPFLFPRYPSSYMFSVISVTEGREESSSTSKAFLVFSHFLLSFAFLVVREEDTKMSNFAR